MVIKSLKIKDQLGVVFLLLFMNVFISQCTLERYKHHFDVKHLHGIKGLLFHVFVILNLADVSKEGIKF